MKELKYTLLSDGSSDKALLPVLTWLLRQNLVNCAIQPVWADLRLLRKPPRSLQDKIKNSLDLYRGDLLFVHRDAETESRSKREEEILEAINAAESTGEIIYVCVVPVRMQEAWLLFDEKAIRQAAGNPRGKEKLSLPSLKTIEAEPNPKQILYDLLRHASGLTGRRLNKLSVNSLVHRVAELINDFTPLRQLSAFQALEAELKQVIQEKGW